MNRRVRVAACLAAAALAACGGGNDPAPASTKVNAASGAAYELAGTTWTTCYADDPAPGQSYWHAWVFGPGTATIRHEVHTAATSCTGPTDPAEHFEIAMGFAVGPARTVGWEDPPPQGYPATVVATGVTFTYQGQSAKGVAYVDDTKTPHRLFVTNPGDTPPPQDADGYPTVLPNFASERQ